MKRKIAFICAILLLVYIPASAIDDGTLSCWYSDSNSVGMWFSRPSISSYLISYTSGFTFSSSYTHARTQWNDAGKTTDIGSNGSADISCYGGSKTTLNNSFGINLSDSINGITYMNYSQYAYLNYAGSTKMLKKMLSATILIVDKNRLEAEYNKTFTHELGHALGWLGHSSRTDKHLDIMYASSSTVQVLTYYDKAHINQIY